MMINMYPTFHEADISKFTAAMNALQNLTLKLH